MHSTDGPSRRERRERGTLNGSTKRRPPVDDRKEPVEVRVKKTPKYASPASPEEPYVPSSSGAPRGSLGPVLAKRRGSDGDLVDVDLTFNGRPLQVKMAKKFWSKNKKGAEHIFTRELWEDHNQVQCLVQELLCEPVAAEGAGHSEGAGAGGKGTAGPSGTVGSPHGNGATIMGRGDGILVRPGTANTGEAHFSKNDGGSVSFFGIGGEGGRVAARCAAREQEEAEERADDPEGYGAEIPTD